MPRRIVKQLARADPCAAPQVVPEHVRRSAHRFAPVVAEPPFHHRRLRCRHRHELHPAAGAPGAGGAGGDHGWRLNVAVAIAATYIVNPLTMVPMYYCAYRVGASLAALPAAAFRVSPDLELARARPRAGLEAVPARLPGMRHRLRLRRRATRSNSPGAGDHAPLPACARSGAAPASRA